MIRSFSFTKSVVLSLIILGVSQSIAFFPQKALGQEASLDTPTPCELKQGDARLQLYGGPRTRTPLVQWYLEELGVDYEYISLDLRAEEHRQAEYLEINPIGKVPAIVDGELKLWESGAIVLYLAEQYGDASLSVEERALLNQWVIFANATLGPGLFREDRREQEMPRLLAPLNDILQEQPFIIGSELSAADIAVGSYLHFAKLLLPISLSDYPAVESYLDRIAERPAFQNTLGQR